MQYVGTFATEKGNKYLYDGTTNMVVPVKQEVAETVSNMDELNRNKILEVADENLKNMIGRWNMFAKPNEIKLSENDVKQYVIEYPYPQLILGLTEDCNLRCKYCVFSGNYDYMRSHSPKKMSFECAAKAVDYFLQLVQTAKEHTPDQQPVISFYGGEVLLEYEMIKKIVEYVLEREKDIAFAFTTNATLLNKEKIKFIVEHNFMISISLDGPKELHDKNRVFPNGQGSYDIAYSNIMELKKEINKQGKALTMPVIILSCYEDSTDMLKLNDFFVSKREELRGFSGRVNEIMPLEYGIEPKSNQSLNRLYTMYVNALTNGGDNKDELYFMDRMFGILFRVINNRYVAPDGGLLAPFFLNSCIPGGKIFVDCDGEFHMCERINYTFPIGSVSTGLDFKRIDQIIKNWQIAVKENCEGCPYTTICGICFARCAEEGKFDIKKVCKNRRLSIEKQLSSFYSVLEENPEIIGFCDEDKGILEEKYERLREVIKGC